MGINVRFLKNQKGSTLIEIISVILVMGIIGVVAAPMFDTSTIDVSVAGDTAQGDIQYVQELAMTRDQNVSIIFNPGSSYVVPADPGTESVYPAETREFPNGISITTGGTITFNSFGEKVGGTQSIILSASNGDTVTITIEQFTGRTSIS